ncbi:FAD-linked oxidase C-terminal domain-containing protein [Dactylosporangium sp. AC04546]|uniref:FAD-binding oxidoreductase n=1 Tax=Dactylosporangium sp. AC04546 TaxID=2862460 RepID=UPI001EDED4E7|nr:FAD-linked oxidase C-terminal domain-containing protein [Dactylosporangium sp. AC04546]WVK84417.1 FAD-linked oxidase C-terminal domain-containing protein [Dactylosporangium sp. AC04546]
MDLVAELRAALPHEGGVLTDPDLLTSYQHDEADLVPFGTPSVVVRPRTTGQVSAVLRAASRHRIPVIPQGARSGLAGGANAIEGAIVLSLTAMNDIVDIDTENGIAVVQPGVVNAQLRRAVAEKGLYYPPDPGSWEQSTIGGNVSTDAGGMCCVKYGVTSDHVIGLEVVLASGEVLHCGRRTAKGVAGYDLTSLFVGSEGTLGVITEITVRLRPAPQPSLTLVAVFDTFAAAGAAVSSITRSGLQPSMLEVIDRVALSAIEAYRPMDLPTTAAALLIAAVDSGSRAPDDLALLAGMCHEAQAADVYVASDAAEADALLAARRLAHPALEQFAANLFPAGGGIMVDDVAVPRTRLVELIEGIEDISTTHGMVVATVGHAGDGNLHPIIVIDRSDPVSIAQGQKVFDAIMSLGLSLGGTSTGEHGVGLLKRDWLAREIGPTGLKAHRSIKAALDPDNILNPGKIF